MLYSAIILVASSVCPFPHLDLFRCCIKSSSSYDDVKVELKDVHSHFEDERVVGVTSSDVAMEENPAYQSVDTTVPQTEEPVYL